MFGPTRRHLQTTNTPFEKLKSNEFFKLLGIKLNPDLKNLDINWMDAIDKARKETFRWKGAKTSVFGWVNIEKTCILSKFNHIATIIPQPKKELMKEIEKINVGFINNSKRHV